MASKNDVEIYLSNFKVKLDIWGLLFRSDRGKNAQTLLDLELSVLQVKEILRQLETEDYSEGPFEEKLYGNAEMWIFGKDVKNVEVYIKISMGMPSAQVLCISFHTAEHPMAYPFKK
jgi:hypothetical protein